MRQHETEAGKAPLTPRFSEAVTMALDIHAMQRRKATDIPYAAHLFAVAALTLEHGGDEDEAIGAMLHDAAEDQGGETVLREIEERFGARVAAIVRDCSDTFEAKKPSWRERKEKHLAHIRLAPPSSRLVALADKVHNLRAIVRDYLTHGEGLWGRFNAGSSENVLWYYESMHEALAHDAADDPRLLALAGELEAEIEALKVLLAAR